MQALSSLSEEEQLAMALSLSRAEAVEIAGAREQAEAEVRVRMEAARSAIAGLPGALATAWRNSGEAGVRQYAEG
mgnify:CR=1 FL=1